MQRLLREKSDRAVTKGRNVASYGPRQEWNVSYEVFRHKAKGVEAIIDKNYPLSRKSCRFTTLVKLCSG